MSNVGRTNIAVGNTTLGTTVGEGDFDPDAGDDAEAVDGVPVERLGEGLVDDVLDVGVDVGVDVGAPVVGASPFTATAAE